MNKETEKQINKSLIIIGTKLNALNATLTDEQRKIYDEYISNSQEFLRNELKGKMSDEEIEEIIEYLKTN